MSTEDMIIYPIMAIMLIIVTLIRFGKMDIVVGKIITLREWAKRSFSRILHYYV